MSNFLHALFTSLVVKRFWYTFLRSYVGLRVVLNNLENGILPLSGNDHSEPVAVVVPTEMSYF
jgi:hypothetical protein